MRIKSKHIILAAVAVPVIVVAIHAVSALTVDRRLAYTEITYASPKITPELDGYVVAFITDTHALPQAELRTVVERLNARKIDILTLGGDFPSANKANWRSMEVLGQTQTTDGIFGVEGNHDNYRDLFKAMQTNGIRPLSNDGLELRSGLYLAGVEDLWRRRPDVPLAIAQAKPNDFVLLISHNPDVSMQQDMRGVDLMLSGHTHGGQITFFGLLAPRLWKLGFKENITDYGQKFMAGWAKGNNGVDVFVSRGSGPTENAPRIFARPQVIIITLRTSQP